jgi:mono/diheme cytochrome c family protein
MLPGFSSLMNSYLPANKCFSLLLISVLSGAGFSWADEASIERGATVYKQYCTECHGQDGRAEIDVISDATDLTDPDAYYSGSDEQDIYNSIAFGAGVAMPGWQETIADDDITHLVNFIRSLWDQ